MHSFNDPKNKSSHCKSLKTKVNGRGSRKTKKTTINVSCPRIKTTFGKIGAS